MLGRLGSSFYTRMRSKALPEARTVEGLEAIAGFGHLGFRGRAG